jgi:hypothetical protein
MMASAPATLAARAGAFALVSLQLGLLLIVVQLFEIESQKNLLPILCVAAVGFAVHSWLPRRLRAGFFVALSWAGIVLVLGNSGGAAVIGVGCGLIVVCLLPVPVPVRVLLLVCAGVALVPLRVQYPEPFWPVLASMFMFRLIVFLYEIRHQPGRPPLGKTLAYFFPLPNICFTLFPVLDFKTWCATYYDEDDFAIYQTGLVWMVRGVTHLLAYRVVKYYLLPSPHQLGDPGHLLLFLAANYALYLRVSGWFHLITGLLHLFGFNLPRTHLNYFLASSFTDIWRRINIYWKDFMTNVFFFPTYFGLRRAGTRLALVAATMVVFVATWLLHSYQTFWLLGDLSLRTSDAVLWLIVGVLAAINMQFDFQSRLRPKQPVRPAAAWAVQSLRVVAMFALVSVFWACWTLPGFINYIQDPTGETVGGAVGIVAAIALAAVVVGVSVHWLRQQLERHGWLGKPLSMGYSAALQCAGLVLLILIALPDVAALLGSTGAETVATLRLDSFTPAEARFAVRGYYEEIAEAPIQAGPWLGALTRKARSADDGAHYTDMTRQVDDLLERELIPNWRGSELSVNERGMRDRPGISVAKPAGTCRIAVVGSSVVMGYGVGDHQVFSRLLDESLNALAPPGGPRYEVLNFGTGMSHAIHRRVLIERKVLAFAPDVLFYVAHQDELGGPPKHLAKLVHRGTNLPYSFLKEVVTKAGVTPDMAEAAIEARLQPFGPELVRGAYQDIIQQCKKRGVLPVWIYLPMPGIVEVSVKTEEVEELAARAGFLVINLARWADAYNPAEVKLTPTDHHANALGHRLIAERLLEALRSRPELLPAWARLD